MLLVQSSRPPPLRKSKHGQPLNSLNEALADLFNYRKEKATGGVFAMTYNRSEALDIAADVYHGVRNTVLPLGDCC